MKCGKLFLNVVFALFVFLWPVTGRAQHYIQALEYGKIDWTHGIIEATGRGRPPGKSDNPAQGRAVAKGEAINRARQNLLKIVEGIRINSKVLIRDLLFEQQSTREALLGLIKKTPLVDVSYGKFEEVSATVMLETRGRFTDLVLPGSFRKIDPVHQPGTAVGNAGSSFSGLIIDCRGFHVKSAIAPLVIDEEGKAVYGPAYISRDHAVKNCVAGYAQDIEAARGNSRVSENPLIIKGIRQSQSGVSDVVISNADAAKIRGTASHLSLLQKCKVVIVID